MRGIFFELDDAQAVVDQLRRGGWEANLRRERLAGEDDDEDHPWAVLTDAPAVQFELLVDKHDGWLDVEDAPSEAPLVAPVPLDLPTEPKRIKRP
ncbi:MAG: hypothetical protein L0H93_23675 [Nocardioides sp.]|nr:hypothetical protein [Nocardioides sp.]